MCFEFEALYWAKLAEEEEKEKIRRAQEQKQASAPPRGELQDEVVPA
ncbi:MAG TPA: hypothetical protein VHA15_07975 [Burkholderiales bacterium]|jgi:hypothetical protein|nr:hypothetical protein [Burkholderiales bacterium]